MSVKLDDLETAVMFMAQAGIAVLKQHDIPHAVTSTRRTAAEQKELFKKGVSKCDGVKYVSNHQLGKAIDIVPTDNGNPVWPGAADPRWFQISNIMKGQGFDWGGDWEDFQDLPHYEVIDIESAFKRAQGIA